MIDIFTSCISWIRWGKLFSVTKSVDGGFVSEFSVISSRNNKIVGWWAYGNFDPAMPYKGQPAFFDDRLSR